MNYKQTLVSGQWQIGLIELVGLGGFDMGVCILVMELTYILNDIESILRYSIHIIRARN